MADKEINHPRHDLFKIPWKYDPQDPNLRANHVVTCIGEKVVNGIHTWEMLNTYGPAFGAEGTFFIEKSVVPWGAFGINKEIIIIKINNKVAETSESLATRDRSTGALSSRAAENEKRQDHGNIEEAETSLPESGSLNYEECNMQNNINNILFGGLIPRGRCTKRVEVEPSHAEMTVEDMRWHKEKRVRDENVLRHPADSQVWEES